MYYVGVDMGGTKIHVAVADEDGATIGEDRRPTPQGPSGQDVTEAILDAIHSACAGADVRPEQVVGAGIGTFGPLDLEAGVVRDPANLPDSVDEIRLTGPISELIGGEEVYLHNDTIAGVIGERYFSDGNPTDMVYLTISTGIGAGVCVDGNVLSGWNGNAGEVGHMKLDPDERMACGCGKAGHWEAYCSGSNLPRYARHIHERDPVETALPIDDPEFRAPDLFDLAGEDAFADRVLERVAEWNAMGMANVVHSFAPEVVFVGGSVALNNPDLTLDPIRERLPDLVFVEVPEVRLTQLGDDVVVKGAVASAMTKGTGDPRLAGQ